VQCPANNQTTCGAANPGGSRLSGGASLLPRLPVYFVRTALASLRSSASVTPGVLPSPRSEGRARQLASVRAIHTTVLLVGHANTTPLLVERLEDGAAPAITGAKYGQLLVFTSKKEKQRVLKPKKAFHISSHTIAVDFQQVESL
jgi:hypothetical protein